MLAERAYLTGDWAAGVRHLSDLFDNIPVLILARSPLYMHYIRCAFFTNDVDLTIRLVEQAGIPSENLGALDAFAYGSALFWRQRFREALPLLYRVDAKEIEEFSLARFVRWSVIARSHLKLSEYNEAAAAANEVLRTVNEFDRGAHVVRAVALGRLGKDPLPGFRAMDYAQLPADDRVLLAEAFLRSGHPEYTLAILQAGSVAEAPKEVAEFIAVLESQPVTMRAACRMVMS
jgi:tetratricopeptide (TPR) repeat protein